MLKHSRGNYTPQQISRCAQMSGPYGKYLDQLISEVGITDTQAALNKKVQSAYLNDIQRFIDEYQQHALCDYLPVRSHDHFEDYQQETRMNSPALMGQKLKELSVRMDKYKKSIKHKVADLSGMLTKLGDK